ncbi:hypothetical protein Ahy_A05g023374 [Arachis hypogaea]|uniref:Cupin type-1 domain-containing protein n=1 Tax=Arachis hypogaea TaxID=3818 RepID=A0A445D3B8_ARAHY|nr:hypothetical protein Ahy_A05g023374 [Arachis hypogaea]
MLGWSVVLGSVVPSFHSDLCQKEWEDFEAVVKVSLPLETCKSGSWLASGCLHGIGMVPSRSPQALVSCYGGNWTLVYDNAVAISGLSSQNSGVVTVANAVFGSTPPISLEVLTNAFQVDKKLINQEHCEAKTQ